MKMVESSVRYGLLMKTYPYMMKVVEQVEFDLVYNQVQNVVGHLVAMRFNELMLVVGNESS